MTLREIIEAALLQLGREATLPRLTSGKLTVFVNDAIRDSNRLPLIRTSARIVGTTVDLSQLDRLCMKVVGVSQEGSLNYSVNEAAALFPCAELGMLMLHIVMFPMLSLRLKARPRYPNSCMA